MPLEDLHGKNEEEKHDFSRLSLDEEENSGHFSKHVVVTLCAFLHHSSSRTSIDSAMAL